MSTSPSAPSLQKLPPDEAVFGSTGDGALRVVAVTVTHAVETARSAHGTLAVATAALGRAMAAAALLAMNLKGQGRLTLRLLGDGPIGAVVADAGSDGSLRGYVQNPRVLLPPNAQGKLDVGRAVGRRGILHISHDIGLGVPYTGSVPLATGEVAEDLARYLHWSEQVPSVVSLGVRLGPGGTVRGAAGVLAQRMPEGEGLVDPEELEATVRSLGSVSWAAAQGLSARDLMDQVLAGRAPGQVSRRPLAFRCTCTRERALRLVRALGWEELSRMAQEDGGAELTCHFCGQVYRFSPEELLAPGPPSVDQESVDDGGLPP
jgi:molecular chaperone Hsp33